MTRGNQREIDRQRAANRHAKEGGEKKGGDHIARKVLSSLYHLYFLYNWFSNLGSRC